ncbi:MSMEG_4193 family putative phosphomutase [Naumannella huperziae]
MTTVLLVRHGRSTANTARVLAGRTPGIDLDETGRGQASRLGDALREVELAAAVTSPLERCRQTAELILAGRGLEPVVEPELTECDYGEWTNRSLGELAKEDLWRTVQAAPSAVTFPGGESMTAMAARGVAAIRAHAARVAAEHGPNAVWLAVSHGDVIKAILADALGLHLDQFQRISTHPAGLSVLSTLDGRTRVLTLNAGTDVAALVPRAPVGEGTPGGDVEDPTEPGAGSPAEESGVAAGGGA